MQFIFHPWAAVLTRSALVWREAEEEHFSSYLIDFIATSLHFTCLKSYIDLEFSKHLIFVHFQTSENNDTLSNSSNLFGT